MAGSIPSGHIFHRLIVQLSLKSNQTVDSLSYLASQSLVEQVLKRHSTIFLCNTINDTYSISGNNNKIVLSAYLSNSVNVTKTSSNPSQPHEIFDNTPKMIIKSNSVHFSDIHGSFSIKTNQLTIFLPGGSLYRVPCKLKDDSQFNETAVSSLLANIKFAVNSFNQLMCLVLDFNSVSKTGDIMKLYTTYSDISHIPSWRKGAMNVRSRVFVRTDNDRGRKKMQEVLVFQAWLIILKYEYKKKNNNAVKLHNLLSELKKQGQTVTKKEEVVLVVAQYPSIFTLTDDNISLQGPSPPYWRQWLSICTNMTPVGLTHVPICPSSLSISLGNKMAVLRNLQGFVCPTKEVNVFRVVFRFSEAEAGFSVDMKHGKLDIPIEGKVIPLTLTMHIKKRKKVNVIVSMGCWKDFKINWPEQSPLYTEETSVDNDDELELLLETYPILSSAVGENEVITLEEEEVEDITSEEDENEVVTLGEGPTD